MAGQWGRLVICLMVFVLALIYALSNVYPEMPVVIVSAPADTQQPVEQLESLLNRLAVHPVRMERQGSTSVLYFGSTDTQIKARDELTKVLPDDWQATLNLVPTTPSWLTAIGANPMKLGLDLRGGVHFLIEVDVSSLQSSNLGSSLDPIKTLLMEKGIRYQRADKEAHQLLIKLRSEEDAKKTKQLLTAHWPRLAVQQEDLLVSLQATKLGQEELESMAVEQAMHGLNNRVNELGVSEAVIQRQGSRYISLDLPGIQDINRAKSLIGRTATLKFQLVSDGRTSSEHVQRYYDKQGQAYDLEPEIALTGQAINFATTRNIEGQVHVVVRLDAAHAQRFHQWTRHHVKRRLAVVFVESKRAAAENSKTIEEHTILSAPVIQSALGGEFSVTGMDKQEADNLALMLRAGALAAPVHIVEETIVGPSLGEENIQRGWQSLLIGTSLVVAFMLLYYRVFGLVANAALLLNVLLILAALSIIDATLTLPGIAGIVLTVGMAVDANVLINERIREELRRGMKPWRAMEMGYDKAFVTILDANITTLMVAMVLFGLGSGTIKGFAVTLCLGLIASMFTSIYVTRTLLSLHYGPKSSTLSIGI